MSRIISVLVAAAVALAAVAVHHDAAPPPAHAQGFAIPVEVWGASLAGAAAVAAGSVVASKVLEENASQAADTGARAGHRNSRGRCGRVCRTTRRYAKALRRWGGKIYHLAKVKSRHVVKQLARWFARRFGRHHIKRTVISAVRGCVGWGVFSFVAYKPDWTTARNGCLGGGAAAVAAARKTKLSGAALDRVILP